MPKKTLPRIVAVTAGRKSSTLRIQWDRADESRVGVSGLIESFRVCEPLRRSPELFGGVRVGEHGTDVVWSDEIDMSADTLWRLAQQQAGVICDDRAASGGAESEWSVEYHAHRMRRALQKAAPRAFRQPPRLVAASAARRGS